MKSPLVIMAVQVLLYLLLCINFRACAQANILVTVSTDALIASLNFFVIKRIASADGTLNLWIAYTVGSCIGSAGGIALSQAVLGQ